MTTGNQSRRRSSVWKFEGTHLQHRSQGTAISSCSVCLNHVAGARLWRVPTINTLKNLNFILKAKNSLEQWQILICVLGRLPEQCKNNWKWMVLVVGDHLGGYGNLYNWEINMTWTMVVSWKNGLDLKYSDKIN